MEIDGTETMVLAIFKDTNYVKLRDNSSQFLPTICAPGEA
jgi:hypothetical protein